MNRHAQSSPWLRGMDTKTNIEINWLLLSFGIKGECYEYCRQCVRYVNHSKNC